MKRHDIIKVFDDPVRETGFEGQARLWRKIEDMPDQVVNGRTYEMWALRFLDENRTVERRVASHHIIDKKDH